MVITSNTSSRKKELLGVVLLILFALTVSSLFGEMITRIVVKDKTVLFPRYHTDAKYGDYQIRRLRPNMEFWHRSIDGSWKFTTNNQGYRSTYDFVYKKPEDTLRVISLGDSHTEGFEVRQEKTYSSIIERYLNIRGIKSEVFNTGISGFSTAEALVYLENEGIKYKPDYVVLGFFANDLNDNIKAGLFALENGKLVERKKKHIPGVRILNIVNSTFVFQWLSENSYLYSFAFNTVWNLAKKALLSKERARLETEFAIPTGKLVDYDIELAGELIKRMYKFCQSNNIRLIILDIPTVAKEGKINSSIPVKLNKLFKKNSDTYINSKTLYEDYVGVVDIHVPHGHRHISELAHSLSGIAVAKTILTQRKNSFSK